MKLGIAVILGFIAVTLHGPFLLADEAQPKVLSWAGFMEPDYGASIYYPSNLFGEANLVDGNYVFKAKKGTAKLILKTYLDPLRTGAEETVSKLKNSKGAHRIIDIKTGDMWFEMVGQDGPDGLVFMRTVYSCKERIVSQFNLIYSKSEKAIYEKVLDKMRKRFQAGVGAKTPIRQCS